MPFQPFNEFEAVHRHERDHQHLPHWRQWGRTYFVTMRLADSVPAERRQEWQTRRDAWLRAHGLSRAGELDRLPETERHEFHREFTERFHQLLDAGHGACALRDSACADLLRTRLVAGHALAYQLDAWVIMPNHAHVLVEPLAGTTLGEVIRHWKGGSGHDINKLLGRRGGLWQKEPFDHIVRSEAQLDHFRRYIALNPERAGLKSGFVLGVGNQGCMTLHGVLAWFALARKTSG